MNYAKILKELRAEKGLSQLEVAKGIDTSQRNIGRWETGANEPSSSFVKKLADFFNVSTDYLLGRENDFGAINNGEFNKLNYEEYKIIKMYRVLSARDKDFIEDMFNRLITPEEKEKLNLLWY